MAERDPVSPGKWKWSRGARMMGAYLIPAWARPEITVGEVEVLDAEGTRKRRVSGRDAQSCGGARRAGARCLGRSGARQRRHANDSPDIVIVVDEYVLRRHDGCGNYRTRRKRGYCRVKLGLEDGMCRWCRAERAIWRENYWRLRFWRSCIRASSLPENRVCMESRKTRLSQKGQSVGLLKPAST